MPSSQADTSLTRTAHPSTSKHVEHVLSRRRIAFQFEPNFRLESIRKAEGTQVRLIEHRAPKDMVKRYAEQMRAGATFPAIVINDRGELVDGNTRYAAAHRNRRESIAAYICSDLSPLEARSLSVELNQTHGLSMTAAELRTFVHGAVREGQSLDTRAYARMTGVTASTLARWVAATHFHLRAQQCGITSSHVATLSESACAALQAARLKSVFREATTLAVVARMPAAHVKRLIATANAATSESEALRTIALERKARSEDIMALAGGFRAAKRRNRRSVMHLKALLRCDTDTILDVAPGTHRETLDSLWALRHHLDVALEEASRRWGI